MLRHWQLLLAGIWGAIAVAALQHRHLPINAFSESQWQNAAIIAGLLTFWNLARWYANRSMRSGPSPATPLKPDARKPPSPYEYNPDLDFQKLERDTTNHPSGG